ncbi:hypothetical protein B484DRAFT_449696 [Ochromonadaceae sp. CCMP2298]|nr:hypothetical protein B484DRAFT_449696 [Ochromonadaceae sp. CCMP2298]
MSAKVRVNSAKKQRRVSVGDVSAKDDRVKRARDQVMIAQTRQNSFSLSRQGSNGKLSRAGSLKEIDILDHSNVGTPKSGNRQRRSSETNLVSLRRRVSFSAQLIDPRPEVPFVLEAVMSSDNSLEKVADTWPDEEDDPAPVKRMRKRMRSYKGRWRRWVPFGSLIPQIFCFWQHK